MTLLAPWAIWFAAVGGAVIALYVLKIKRRQQTVPALDFWRELAGKTKVHSLFKSELKKLHKDYGKSSMPSYADALSKEELDDLVAFLVSQRDEK